MGVPWRSSADEFSRILREYGQEPTAGTDVAAAWRAFCEFLHVEIKGFVPEPDADVDGFIVQWGRYSWHGGRQCVSFTRQLAVPTGSSDPQPDYWDFVYFSFVLGMTFQVSDVQVTRKRVRRLVVAHGIVSFFFSVTIIALMVSASSISCFVRSASSETSCSTRSGSRIASA